MSVPAELLHTPQGSDPAPVGDVEDGASGVPSTNAVPLPVGTSERLDADKKQHEQGAGSSLKMASDAPTGRPAPSPAPAPAPAPDPKDPPLSRTVLDRLTTAPFQKIGYERGHAYTHERVESHGRQSMSGQRLAQLLRHLSTTLLKDAQGSEMNPIEVQSLMVNGRLLIAGNSDNQMTEYAKRLESNGLEAAAAGALRSVDQAISAAAGKGVAKPRLKHDRRQINKFLRVLRTGQARGSATAQTGDEESGDAAFAADLAQLIAAAKAARIVQTGGETAAGGFLTRKPSDQPQIMVMTAGFPHAEQKLLAALLKSKLKTPATIRGTKRPCIGCYLCLTFARERMGVNVRFSQEPGLGFDAAFSGLDKFVRMHLKAFPQGSRADVSQYLLKNLPEARHQTKVGDEEEPDETGENLSDSEDDEDDGAG